ncbi:phage DNA-binding protein [Trabulsiella guamensis ATCC 49490]|uniref:Phage DNA-binding protein n=1 Tax=Trabulsiella guamensis ATCC 49490 TaxID=1005994 RepID=A0A085A9Y4_9ENTR|nr:helix-turn-helix transcriptional regulator [Trabulsiella guamensis]KFC07029.1 phage DNA-binding protein [Trabulsiella guamensis ATCC 49490]
MQSPLRVLRKSQHLTLSHVAKMVGIDQSNLSRIERGQQKATPDVAERLVSLFPGQINELQILYPQRYMNQAGASDSAEV